MFSSGFEEQLFVPVFPQRSRQLRSSPRWELSPPRRRSNLTSPSPLEVFLCWSTEPSGGSMARAAGHRASTTSSKVRRHSKVLLMMSFTFPNNENDQVDLIGDFVCHVTGTVNELTIVGLKPETSYQVQLSAINGKGEGESSATDSFKTEPVSKWETLKFIWISSGILIWERITSVHLSGLGVERRLYSNAVMREKSVGDYSTAGPPLNLRLPFLYHEGTIFKQF